MPSAHLLHQNGLRCIGEFILRGSVKSSLPGISCFFFEQAFSTSRRNINPIPQLGPCSGTLTERGPIDPQKAAPVVGTLCRTFVLPSVSGISYQSYYNRDQLLSETCQRPLHSPLQGMLMAACGSLLGGAKPPVLNFDSLNRRNGRMLGLMIRVDGANCAKWIECSGRVSMRVKNRKPHGTNMVYRCFWSYAGDKSWVSINNPFPEAGAKCFHVSSAVSNSAGAAPDVSFDGSIREEQFENSAVSSDQKVLGDRTLKLLSGSCYLPHPAKEETGGEDAHFIVDEQAIGVADGVGGWADLGVNAGHYARELMSHSVSAIQEEPEGSIDPARVLEKAYSGTKAKGSSTACIIALTNQGIRAVNLGDSGFTVVRDGCTIFRSPVQQHDFNFTYQLESGNGSDLPSAAQVYTFPVALGDVVIAGTDGLFDNLYNNEITAVVVQAVRAGLGPQVAAQKIAALARQRAQDKNRQTPFSTAAQDAGYRYHGGKLDDITVVVSYIKATNK